MKLKEIMTHNVEIIHPEDTLQVAAQKMRDRNVGFLPVYEGGELIGVVTDRDITVRAIAKGADPRTMLKRGLITTPAIYCLEDQSVDDATDLMHDNQIRRLVILKRGNRQLAGVVSLGDLAMNVDDKMTAEVLQSVSVP